MTNETRIAIYRICTKLEAGTLPAVSAMQQIETLLAREAKEQEREKDAAK
jgi:hypothetical protein